MPRDSVFTEPTGGTANHSELQAALAAYFFRRRKAWKIEVFISLTFNNRDGRYMIPDVCVVQDSVPREPTLSTPPLIWIEILSPEDRHVRVTKKVKDALAFGTPYVWVIDPETLESEIHTQDGSSILTDAILRIPATEIIVPLAEVFQD